MGAGRLAIALCFAFSGCLAGCLQPGKTDTGSSAASGSSSEGQGSIGGTTGRQASGSSGTGTSTGIATGTSGGVDPCASKSCNPGLICDPADGQCKCYLGGPACGSTQLCDPAGNCVDDPCFGLVCTATGAACFGGVCKCGGPNGVECSEPGNSCSPIDESCDPTASCAITPCAEPGTICDPSDPIGSQCHCGTIGGPVCTKAGSCQLYLVDGGPLAPGEDAGGQAVYGQCKTNSPCYGVTCPPNEACDPNNFDPQTLMGLCECGGDPTNNLPGVVCGSSETCVALDDAGAVCQPE
jgi:hypothetical protein